jgi:hypothetical protein
VKKLVDAGVHTVEGLARSSRRRLAEIRGLSEQKVEKLKQIGASSEPKPERGRLKIGRALNAFVGERARERERERERDARRGERVPGLRGGDRARARAGRETRGER